MMMKDLFSIDFKGMFRGLLFSILGTALILCLFFIVYGLVFNLVTSRPEKVKDIFARSSLYSDLPAVLYDQATKETKGGQLEIPLKDSEIRQIVLDVYNPEFVQSSTEKLIDGTYGWLGGKTQQPMISLDFGEKNKEFANRIAVYAKKQAVKLPVCDLSQLQKLDDFNVFNAKCLPPTITPAQVKKIFSKIDSSFLDAKFSAQDIKTSDGEPLYESFENLPKFFSLAKNIPFILAMIALMLIITIVYVSKDRISGLKRVSRSILLAGILIALLPVIFLSGINIIVNNLSDNDKIIAIIRTLFEEFMHEASTIYYGAGVLLILAAAGLYIYARKIQKNTDKISKTKT